MMKSLLTRLSPLFIALCLLSPFLSAAFSEEKAPAKGDDWLTFYYRDPQPDQVVAQLKAWSSEGTLQNENARAPLTGFLSQVFRQNADQIENWYTQLKGLPEGDLQFIILTMWISGTEESKKLIQKEHPGLFDKKNPPDILTIKLDSAATLDLLWGYYFATGDSKALRRVVAMFKFADASEKVKGLPEGRVPLYTMLPEAAKWSLSSNAERHPRILKDCKKMLTDGQLSATEKKWLSETLQLTEDALKKP